mmetsp:Transcript_4260/g.7246  ORF Transcript_4260/g.7246 Transcript_4260/m.7246 type:complete len:212 (+) Transcript_4260:304-939(+)
MHPDPDGEMRRPQDRRLLRRKRYLLDAPDHALGQHEQPLRVCWLAIAARHCHVRVAEGLDLEDARLVHEVVELGEHGVEQHDHLPRRQQRHHGAEVGHFDVQHRGHGVLLRNERGPVLQLEQHRVGEEAIAQLYAGQQTAVAVFRQAFLSEQIQLVEKKHLIDQAQKVVFLERLGDEAVGTRFHRFLHFLRVFLQLTVEEDRRQLGVPLAN